MNFNSDSILDITINKMNKRWNVIIMTLFITFIIWIMWLIITKYAVNLINIASENYKYYKSYYVAYGAIELELSKIKYHGIWFSDETKTTEKVVTDNFTGWSPNIKYNFESKIYTSWLVLNAEPSSLWKDGANCSDSDNWIELGTWEWFMTALFYDKNTDFSWKDYQQLNVSPSDIEVNYDWEIIVSFQEDWNSKQSATLKWKNDKSSISSILTWLNFENSTNPYIVFGAKKPSKVCVKSENSLISPYSYIKARWNYMDRSVQVNVLKKNNWANFAIYWIY